MNNILILGAGQIGQAAKIILSKFTNQKKPQTLGDILHLQYPQANAFSDKSVFMWDKFEGPLVDKVVDLSSTTVNELSEMMRADSISYVINALPFLFNEKVALAAVSAGCNYIDFTEDDEMAEKVQSIFSSSSLTCAVKCGLAPGFINYVGHSLVKRIDQPNKLLISVGALPRTARFSKDDPGSNYNLSWSIDGLVNEYIRPCNVKINGKEAKIQALSGIEKILIDGIEYEAAYTSGGIGSLVKELDNVPNVSYKTLRYPGHYSYVIDVVKRNNSDFDRIKKEFEAKFPFCKDDVIVVFAECIGKMENGELRREVFSTTFTGMSGLSAIQTTTAGGALIVLELILKNRISGIINHSDVLLAQFINTETYKSTYSRHMKG